MKAIWNEEIIAESDDTLVVEGNHYFPTESVNFDYLEASKHTSSCPWKGTASYYTLKVKGETNTDAAWYYAAPKQAAKDIGHRIAFWKGVQIVK